jgi:parallel beta-helix repeat protein
MKKQLTVFIASATLSAFGQGVLTPPGSPAPTMKTLSQVEPRTPISSVPYTITESGSYYLTANLSSTTDGVIITTNNVTLDLMGFTISGDGNNYNDQGIYLYGATNSAIQNVVVHNGIVRNFGVGILAEYAQDSRSEHLIITANTDYGIKFDGGEGQCDGNTITDCTISCNGSFGIYLSGYSGQCDGNTITDCTVRDNGDFGVQFYGKNGQCDGNTIANCTILNNFRRGISLYQADNNRVEGNHVTDQTDATSFGIWCGITEGNLVVRNTCVGQTYNFTMDSDDTYGPIVTTSGPLSDTNPWANFSR